MCFRKTMAIFTFIMLFLSFIVTAHPVTNNDKLIFNEQRRDNAKFITRLNLGVLFDPIAILDNSNTYFNYYLEIRKLFVPRLSLKIANPCKQDIVNNITNTFKLCLMYDTLISNYERQANLLQKDIKQSIDTAHTLLDTYNTNSYEARQRRGLFNAVGKGFRYLFNTATLDDIHKSSHTVQQIATRQNKLLLQVDNIKAQAANYMSLQTRQNHNLLERIRNTVNRTTILQQQMTVLTNSIRRSNTDLSTALLAYGKYMMTYTTLVSQRIAALTMLQTQALEYLQDANLLLIGKISIRMLPIERLEEIYKVVQTHLNNERSSFFITDPNPINFYNAPNFLFYTETEKIYLHLRIPLSSYQATFEIYKIIVIPLPVNYNNSTNMYTTYKLPTMLALTTNKNYYIELTQDDYESCKGLPVKHCSSNLPIRPSSQPSCALAIFNDDMDLVKTICDSTLTIDNNISQQIRHIQDDTYFVTGPRDVTPWVVTCDNQHHPLMTPCTLCIITLPCKCSLTTSQFFLPKTAYTCDRNGEKISTLIQQYHINFNFLSSWYYNASTVEALTAHSFVNYTPNIQLPPILASLPELSSKELLEYDRIDLNMKKLVHKIRNDKDSLKPIIQTPFINTYDNTFKFSHTTTTIIAVAHYIITIALIVTTVYLAIRLHYMAQLLASVTASTVIIPHANALTLTHDWPKEKVNEESYIQIPVTLAYTLTTIVTVLSLTIVAIVIKQCFTHIINFYTHYYNRSAVYTDILLELTTHTRTTTLHVITIPIHYSQIEIRNVSASIYPLIHNCCTAYLRVNWHQTTITALGKFTKINLPDMISVPILAAHQVKEISYDPNLYMTLWIGMNGRYHTNIINNETKLQASSMALTGTDDTNPVQTGDNSHIHM